MSSRVLISAGDILELVKDHGDGWADCTSTTTRKTGLIPVTFFQALTPNEEAAISAAPKSPLRIRIHVVEGRHLVIRDLVSSDPYVVVKVGDITQKTRVVTKNLSPKFDEVFYFDVKEEDRTKTVIKLTVFDYDLLTSHDSMGEVIIPLASLEPGKQDMWLPLQEVARGELHIIITS